MGHSILKDDDDGFWSVEVGNDGGKCGVGDKVSDVFQAIRPADHWECENYALCLSFATPFSFIPTGHIEEATAFVCFSLLHTNWILIDCNLRYTLSIIISILFNSLI